MQTFHPLNLLKYLVNHCLLSFLEDSINTTLTIAIFIIAPVSVVVTVIIVITMKMYILHPVGHKPEGEYLQLLHPGHTAPGLNLFQTTKTFLTASSSDSVVIFNLSSVLACAIIAATIWSVALLPDNSNLPCDKGENQLVSAVLIDVGIGWVLARAVVILVLLVSWKNRVAQDPIKFQCLQRFRKSPQNLLQSTSSSIPLSQPQVLKTPEPRKVIRLQSRPGVRTTPHQRPESRIRPHQLPMDIPLQSMPEDWQQGLVPQFANEETGDECFWFEGEVVRVFPGAFPEWEEVADADENLGQFEWSWVLIVLVRHCNDNVPGCRLQVDLAPAMNPPPPAILLSCMDAKIGQQAFEAQLLAPGLGNRR
ncbi:hypothetical protein BKA57DRAFT_487692 [Linnemannia elongata]|nr:hypothetical protein BKA57DRAFT_487692 [Linnemannia elongata]